MPILITILAAAVAFVIVYPSIVAVGYRILSNEGRLTWSVKLGSHGAAIFSSFGFMKLLINVLSFLLIGLSLDQDKLDQAIALAIVFPLLTIISSWLLIRIFRILRRSIPVPASEDLYLQFMIEAQGSGRRESLWAKCLIKCNGDEKRALADYVRIRINEKVKLPQDAGKNALSENNSAQIFSSNLPSRRLWVLLIIAFLIVVFYFHILSSKNAELERSVTIGNTSGIVNYDLIECQNCINGKCENNEKIEGLVINFSSSLGYLRVKFISEKGVESGWTTTPWQGCVYQIDGNYIANCNSKYDASDSRQTHNHQRLFDGTTYEEVDTLTNWYNQIVRTESLTCKAIPSAGT